VARLRGLRKNSTSFGVLKGHELIRANKSNQFSAALADKGRFSMINDPVVTFSASSSVVPQRSQNERGLQHLSDALT
jgi:hypothetical protein